MSITEAEKRVTTCKHCGLTFDGGVEIIGRPSARMEALLTKLGSHMNTKHPEHAGALQMHGAAFIGMLFLMNFRSTDEELNLHRDQLRWQIHQQTLNARFSDASLREQCASLSDRLLVALVDAEDTPDAAKQAFSEILIEVFTGMRNDLEEPNRYSTAAAPSIGK